MKRTTKQRIGYVIGSSALLGGLLLGSTAFAAGPGSGEFVHGMMGRAPGVRGTVTAVSGNTITITSQGYEQNTAQTTYTIDASKATVMKNGSVSSISGISVGDRVSAQGTVSGTNITATTIRDGVPQGGRRGEWSEGAGPFGQTAASFPQGNGQPVIGGTVTAISGSTLTVTNKGNIAYSVDAANATVTKEGATSTYSNIATGDRVIVQGGVNGTTVTASSIIDSGALPQTAANAATQNASNGVHRGFMAGFFGGIGGFFHSLFGFF